MEALAGIVIGLALLFGFFELLKFSLRHLVGILFALFVMFLLLVTLAAGG